MFIHGKYNHCKKVNILKHFALKVPKIFLQTQIQSCRCTVILKNKAIYCPGLTIYITVVGLTLLKHQLSK